MASDEINRTYNKKKYRYENEYVSPDNERKENLIKRVFACLRCDKKFTTFNKYNRLCEKCTQTIGNIDTTLAN